MKYNYVWLLVENNLGHLSVLGVFSNRVKAAKYKRDNYLSNNDESVYHVTKMEVDPGEDPEKKKDVDFHIKRQSGKVRWK